METISLTINGQQVEATQGMTVLEAAQAAGVYIPTLCHHPDLEPHGGCRLCIVEIEKERGLPTSCTTPARNEMVVQTESEAINTVRRTALELLLSSHPCECLECHRRDRCGPFDICLRQVAVTDRCVVCPANEYCELQEVVDYLGIHDLRIPKDSSKVPIDASNPFFDLDRNRCILCARCVRTCQEITGVGAIDLANRGYSMKVATFGDKPLMESVCRSCGECMVRCPVGAIIPKETYFAEEETETTCPYCGVGCQISLGISDGHVVGVRGNEQNSVNQGLLCVKGRFGINEFVHHSDRLTNPLIKRNGHFEEASWEEVLALVSSKLEGYKSNQIGVISSAKSTNEDNYVMQKFARVVLGTNNIDHCARLCHSPTVAGLTTTFGSGAMTNSIEDIKHTKCILAIGTNTTSAHPVIAMHIRQATVKGTKLIVTNPLEIDLVRYADLWLQHRPGTDVALLMGMMKLIVDEGLMDSAFIEQRCENFDAFRESLDNFPIDLVAQITGVPGGKIAEAARMYATSGPAMLFYAMGITQHSHGTDNVIATANLAMLTGNIGQPGTGVNPLRGQNNMQGACDMGALPNVYPGYQSVADAAIKEKFEVAWKCSLDPSPGKVLTEIIPAAGKGEIKAIYIMGENPVLSDPDATHVTKALSNLEFLVVQDMFLTETAQLADVVLPSTSFAEKDGTFTNTERRVQRVRQAIDPIGSSKPDWWITSQIARRMRGKGFDYEHPSQIMEEITSVTPSYGGISYHRLDEESGLQWPCPTEEHPGTAILHMEKFSRGRGMFMPLEYKVSAELPDEEFPLLLTTERSLFHYHTGTMTRKVKGLNIFHNAELVRINPEDAEALDIDDGEVVHIISRRGEVTAKALVTEASPSGVVSMSFHFAESPTNQLTSPALDPVSKIPELKVCAVRIKKNGVKTI
ncbi:formate dehydrogenase subunit alpha [Chloroflexota bacterium]